MYKNQKGLALIVSLVLLTSVLLLGLSGMQASRLGESAAANYRASYSALMAAEYGAAEQVGNLNMSLLSECFNQPFYGVFVSVGNTQNDSTGYYYEACEEGGGELVRITVKGESGGINRYVQAGYTFPNSKFLGLSPLTIPADVASFEAPSSNSFIVEGAVEQSFMGSRRPAISSSSEANKKIIMNGIGDRDGNYSGGVSGSISESLLNDAKLFDEFVNHLISVAQVFSDVDKRTDLGTVDDPKISYVTGNVDVKGNSSGSGILIVEGDYGLSGTPHFDGLVILLGSSFGFSGGGRGGIDGAMVLAPMVDTDEGKAFGSVNVVGSGGGNASYSYNSESLDRAFNLLPEHLQNYWLEHNTSSYTEPGLASWSEINVDG